MSKRLNPIVRFAVERRVTLTMIVAGVMVMGWMSLRRLPLEFLPTFSSSSIWISASYPSSSPEETQRLIVQPLEDSLGTINGIETLSASAGPEGGSVSLTFVDGTDMEMAAVEVRDRLDRVRHLLPADLDRIWVRRFQSTDIPVVRFQLSADWPRERLFDFAENVVQRRLERLEGVAQVSLGGLQTPKVQIDLDRGRMQAHRVSVRQLAARLRRDNQDSSAGKIQEGSRELLVRSLGELRSLEEIRRLPIDAAGLRLGDVAEVSYTFPRQEEFNFLNGREALTVRVNKVSTANLLAVVDRVKAEMQAIDRMPQAEGLRWRIYRDASVDVRRGLAQLRNAGIFGAALAILSVFFFLRRYRTTLLIAVAIPLSVVTTFVAIYFLRLGGLSDITLNVVSLAGLMLALGMLVDNSIVVIESIFRHRNELHQDARTAALEGASEVALPIIASTATTVCVFLPVVFLGGGGWLQTNFENIATTVCIVMISSLLGALTVVPMVAGYLLRGEVSGPPGIVQGMRGAYAAAVRFTLRHRAVFLGLVVVLLAGSLYLFDSIEPAFTQRTEERFVGIQVDTPRQYSLEETRALFAEIYGLLDANRERLGIADISYEYDRGTGRSRGGWRGGRRFDIYLADESEVGISTAAAREAIRALLPTRAGVNLRIAQGRGHSANAGIEVELSGEDPQILAALSERLQASLASIPVLRDVDTSLESGDEEIRVRVLDDRILQAGLSSREVALTVNNALSSRPVSYFRTADREVDMVLQYREADRATLEQLKQVPVLGAGAPLPLDAVADFEMAEGPSSIERENHLPKVQITANTGDGRASYVASQMVTRLMTQTPLPPGYSWSFGRWNRYQQNDLAMGWSTVLFATALVYMLMAALFESFAQPLVIMFSVLFAPLGVGVVMKLANQPRDSMTMIGFVILLGVVVNNAIVLIDHINLLRRQGMARDEAIVLGGQHRLRPILITAVTTLVGLLPLVAPLLLPQVFGPVEGRAGTWAPIGLVIMGGLTTSTFLTLLITPTIYSLVDDVTYWLRRVASAV